MAKNELIPMVGDNYLPFTATGNLLPGSGGGPGQPYVILGIWVSATTSGTLALYDSTGTATTDPIFATTTFANVGWYPFPAKVSFGVYAVVGGTLSATLVYSNP